jgi:hypothetical protein
MLKNTETRTTFWESLRQLAPDLVATTVHLAEVRRRLRMRLDALTDRPLDDDKATAEFHRLGVLYNESFGRGV